MSSTFDVQRLAILVRAKREHHGLREIAREIGNVSASTLSRLDNGKTPDMDTFLRLCDWLQVAPEIFFVGSPEERQPPSTLQQIECLMGEGTRIPTHIIDAIMTLIREYAKEGK